MPKVSPDFVFYTSLPQEGILPPKYVPAGITPDLHKQRNGNHFLRIFDLLWEYSHCWLIAKKKISLDFSLIWGFIGFNSRTGMTAKKIKKKTGCFK